MNKAIHMCFHKALVSTKIDAKLNGQALFDPAHQWCLTGLIKIRAHIKLRVWHLDVGLSFQKSVLSLLVGVLIP